MGRMAFVASHLGTNFLHHHCHCHRINVCYDSSTSAPSGTRESFLLSVFPVCPNRVTPFNLSFLVIIYSTSPSSIPAGGSSYWLKKVRISLKPHVAIVARQPALTAMVSPWISFRFKSWDPCLSSSHRPSF